MTPGMPTGRGGVAGGIGRRSDCASVLMCGGVLGVPDSLAPPCLIVGVSAGGNLWVSLVVYRCEED